MARRRCAPTSNASRANSWRRTSSSPRKPPSTTPRRSIRRRGACSSRPIIKEIGGHRIAVIGQAFPYVPIAHPEALYAGLEVRHPRRGAAEARRRPCATTTRSMPSILLSHNGMDVDLKLASRVTGIDVILGGHTHDAVPQPIAVTNAGGTTLVTNAGSNGKFLGGARSRTRQGQGQRCALPAAAGVFGAAEARSGDAGADRQDCARRMRPRWTRRSPPPTACSIAAAISAARMDQLICDALRGELNAEIALSPGFRWGTTALAGQPLTMEDVMAQTAVTYPETYVQTMTGGQIKDVLEDICDNLFNTDPYYQQGGDMVRVGGLAYTCSSARERRQADFRSQARQRPRATGRQELQGSRMGLRQRTDRRAGLGRGRQASEIGQAAQPGGAGRDAERRRGQSGHRGTRMNGFSKTLRMTIAALLIAAAARCPRPAGAAAGQAVCRAQDRAAALRQRPAQAGSRAVSAPAI